MLPASWGLETLRDASPHQRSPPPSREVPGTSNVTRNKNTNGFVQKNASQIHFSPALVLVTNTNKVSA